MYKVRMLNNADACVQALQNLYGKILPWQVLKVIKKALKLFLEETTVKIVFELLVPKGSNVDFRTLWYIDHLGMVL